MVPMRLLPFRAICVLGMNDGDYPRRDPAAGLNQLTAELGTKQRRHGDRSLREDDRYLFLQLFSAASEVFYLSYLGADPRDGSVRESSVLVSELLDAAARYHADPVATARRCGCATRCSSSPRRRLGQGRRGKASDRVDSVIAANGIPQRVERLRAHRSPRAGCGCAGNRRTLQSLSLSELRTSS